MVIDGLTFVGESLFGHRASPDELLRAMDAAGVDQAVVCPMKPRRYDLGPANQHVANAVRAHGDRFVGFARVDPNLGEDAVSEAARSLEDRGLVGLFLHPWEETFRASSELLDPLAELAAERHVPVLLAAGYPWLSEALQVADLARRHPRVAFVATNGGQINISGLGQVDAELALERCANISLQTAGVYREDFLEGVGSRFGASRLHFASSFPFMDPRLEIRRVQWAQFDDDAKADILGTNTARLLENG